MAISSFTHCHSIFSFDHLSAVLPWNRARFKILNCGIYQQNHQDYNNDQKKNFSPTEDIPDVGSYSYQQKHQEHHHHDHQAEIETNPQPHVCLLVKHLTEDLVFLLVRKHFIFEELKFVRLDNLSLWSTLRVPGKEEDK